MTIKTAIEMREAAAEILSMRFASAGFVVASPGLNQ